MRLTSWEEWEHWGLWEVRGGKVERVGDGLLEVVSLRLEVGNWRWRDYYGTLQPRDKGPPMKTNGWKRKLGQIF